MLTRRANRRHSFPGSSETTRLVASRGPKAPADEPFATLHYLQSGFGSPAPQGVRVYALRDPRDRIPPRAPLGESVQYRRGCRLHRVAVGSSSHRTTWADFGPTSWPASSDGSVQWLEAPDVELRDRLSQFAVSANDYLDKPRRDEVFTEPAARDRGRIRRLRSSLPDTSRRPELCRRADDVAHTHLRRPRPDSLLTLTRVEERLLARQRPRSAAPPGSIARHWKGLPAVASRVGPLVRPPLQPCPQQAAIAATCLAGALDALRFPPRSP